MNTGLKNGKLVIDMAEAEELWQSMSKDQQFDAMCAMFEPLIAKATKMKIALESIVFYSADYDYNSCHDISKKALED